MAPVKAPPSRQELLELAVTDVDAFGAHRYLRHRDAVPALPELETSGEAVIPGAAGCLADLLHALWSPEPGMREDSPADRRYWAGLLGEAVKTASFQELHAQTQLKELQAVLGTVAMGESVLATVPKEDQAQLQQVAQAQAEANQMVAQANQAQANASAAGQLAEAAAAQAANPSAQAQGAASGSGQPGQEQLGQSDSPSQGSSQGAPQGGQPGGAGRMSAAQAQAMADQLAQQADQAKAEAQAASQQAAKAQARANQLADQLMGMPGTQEAADKARQLAQQAQAAIKAAQDQVKEISDTIESWGVNPGELTREGFAEVQAIQAAIKRNPALAKFTRLLGRMKLVAARKARSKDRSEGTRLTVTETGRDLKRAHAAELIALTQPALRVKALTRWSRGELRLHGQQARRKLGHGPVVVLEDASGSMDGAKQQWAKGLVLALAHFAKLRRRSFGWVMFDYGVRLSRAYPQGALSATQMLEIAESRAGGGTDFERPLRAAVKMIQEAGLKKADILLVTDGMCAVSAEFLKELLAVKKELEVQIITVLVDMGDSADATVRAFSDRIVPISAFTAEEAESKVIGLL